MNGATTGAGGLAVRMTGRGFGLLVAVAAAAALAELLGYRELRLFAAAGAGALLAGTLALVRPVSLDVAATLDHQHVSRGDPARLTVTVTNPAARRSPPVAVTVQSVAVAPTPAPAPAPTPTPAPALAPAPAGSPTDRAGRRGVVGGFDVPGLAAGASVSFDLDLDTSIRGLVLVGPVTLRRTDRFSLLARLARSGVPVRLHVWPRPREIAPLASPRSRDAGGRGFDGAPGGVMFNSLRTYVPGDDLRRVHWPSSARRGELLVREYAEPSEPTSTVLLDTRPAGYPPGPAGDVGFDEAVDVAASVVLASTRVRTPVRLVTTGGLALVGRRRRSDEAAFLDALAVVSREPAATLDVVATSRRGGVGTLTVVTGVVDAGQLEAVAPVVHRFEQVVVLRVGAGASPISRSHPHPHPSQDSRPGHVRPEHARPTGTAASSGLRVVVVRTAAELPTQWPARGRSVAGVALPVRAAGL